MPDWIDVALQVISLLLVAGGLLYAGRQLQLLRMTHADNHEWNRRKAAQDATLLFSQRVENRELLREKLEYTTRRDPISLQDLEAKFKETPALRDACASLLNYYEALARGVNQHVYDEEIIKTAWRGVMARNFDRLRQYVDHRRRTGSPKAWIESEKLIEKWREQDQDVANRPPTGLSP